MDVAQDTPHESFANSFPWMNRYNRCPPIGMFEKEVASFPARVDETKLFQSSDDLFCRRNWSAAHANDGVRIGTVATPTNEDCSSSGHVI